MAKQSIFGRIAQLTRANINGLLDQAEDPSTMLDQMVRDYTNSIAEAEEAVATTIGNLRLLEQDHAEDVEALYAELLAAERPRGVFSRQLILGDNLDTQNITASYDGGVLTLRIPVAEQAKPRKITVSSDSNDQQAINA